MQTILKVNPQETESLAEQSRGVIDVVCNVVESDCDVMNERDVVERNDAVEATQFVVVLVSDWTVVAAGVTDNASVGDVMGTVVECAVTLTLDTAGEKLADMHKDLWLVNNNIMVEQRYWHVGFYQGKGFRK